MTPYKTFLFCCFHRFACFRFFFSFDLQSTSFLCLSCLFLSGLFPTAQPSLLCFLTKVVADVLITKLFSFFLENLLQNLHIIFGVWNLSLLSVLEETSLLKTIYDYWILSKTIEDYQILLKTTEDYQRLLKTINDFQRLLKTIVDYHRLS